MIEFLFAIIALPAFGGSVDFYGSDGSYQGTMQSAGPNNNFFMAETAAMLAAQQTQGTQHIFTEAMALMLALQNK